VRRVALRLSREPTNALITFSASRLRHQRKDVSDKVMGLYYGAVSEVSELAPWLMFYMRTMVGNRL